MRNLTSLIKWMKTGNVIIIVLAMLTAITAIGWMTFGGGTAKAEAQEKTELAIAEETAHTGKAPDSAWGMALLAAAISTSVSALAAGIAVAIVGSAAMAAVAEKPEIMGRSIIFVGLAEGIAIYGLIISIMILGKI